MYATATRASFVGLPRLCAVRPLIATLTGGGAPHVLHKVPACPQKVPRLGDACERRGDSTVVPNDEKWMSAWEFGHHGRRQRCALGLVPSPIQTGEDDDEVRRQVGGRVRPDHAHVPEPSRMCVTRPTEHGVEPLAFGQ